MSIPPRLQWHCPRCDVRGADPLPVKCWNCGKSVQTGVPALVLPSGANE